MSLECPKCTSTEVRRLSLIYQEGLSTINTQSTTVGSAIGGGGIGFATASTGTTGHQQTALSKQAAPPAKKHWILWSSAAAIVALPTLGTLLHPGFGTLVGLGLVALSVRMALSGRKYNAEVHPGVLHRWEQSFMCNRCGDVFAAT